MDIKEVVDKLNMLQKYYFVNTEDYGAYILWEDIENFIKEIEKE